MKTKIYLGIGIFIFLLISYSVYTTKQLVKVKKDKDRLEFNFVNSSFKIDSLKDKNGNYYAQIKQLIVKQDEFEQINLNLTEKVKNLNIKIKNLSSVDNISYRYIYNIDSIPVWKTNDTTFKSQFKDNWLSINQLISLKNKKTTIKIDSLKIELKDGLIFAHEILYKRKWIFWKKIIGMELKVQSNKNNPYFKIDTIQSYQFIK